MLKVLHAEPGRTPVTLPILSYDAAPENGQISDEFRDLLEKSQGATGAQTSNNLSEIVAAALMAGAIPAGPAPAFAQRAEDGIGDQDAPGKSSTNSSLAGGGGREAGLSQSAGELELSGRRQEQSGQDANGQGALSEQNGAGGESAQGGEKAGVDQMTTGCSEESTDVAAVLVKQGVATIAKGEGVAEAAETGAFAEASSFESLDMSQLSDSQRKIVENRMSDSKSNDISSVSSGVNQSSQATSEAVSSMQESSTSAPGANLAPSSGAQRAVVEQSQAAASDGSRGPLVAHGSDLSGFSADLAGSVLRRNGEASAQLMLLRQSFEYRQGSGRDGVSASAGVSANGSNGFASNSLGADRRSGSASELRERGRAESNPMSRQTALRMLERVQVTLKEAARARDGKTLSINLEPVDLGRIKVDVSLRDGALHARLKPENGEVLQKLREHAHELQAALRKLGLDVERVTVTVSADEAKEESSFDGNQSGDGKGFQDDRNNMPRNEGQLPENTFGNELAQGLGAVPDEAKTATTVWRDNWVA